ncbi:MAG TPA: tRNA (guanosine(46)-N7)-methyltransferase TrmB [Bacilli bacterium]|nr:tRNA (guanosine(46)-N7)-methyltransferase TrmB [Bacilli bacterium]
MRQKLKKWSKPFLVDHPEVYISEEDYNSEQFLEYISRPNLCLEIGPGKGDFIVQMATKHPDINYLVIELNISVAAMTAVKIVEAQLNNVKLIVDDALVVLPLLKAHSLDAIYLNFSDPWPKKRHEKRRLTSSRFLNVYKDALKVGAPLFQKTDQQSLYEFSLESFTEHNWKIVEKTEDYKTVLDTDAMTEYERNFRSQGHKIYRIITIKE